MGDGLRLCPFKNVVSLSWLSLLPGIAEEGDETYAKRKKGPGWVGERKWERDGLPAQRCTGRNRDPSGQELDRSERNRGNRYPDPKIKRLLRVGGLRGGTVC
ncbi:hypothetical protein Cadr_000011816 [Camelus dromedarius]|uniref:Uncharacterized protein n=1 Tax=Camelus dromedarius TaxID=9838 RepID=A0A5N4DTT2_CAMDR|nr:hypothetical protein Cadr_000011816 [Camelus dromedarius]